MGTENYNQEWHNAHAFGFTHGLTTAETFQDTDMESPLTRGQLAKLMVNYAINILGKTLNTSATCSFTDLTKQSLATQTYAVKACQLGLMGTNTSTFLPTAWVTREQLGTIISKLLYATPDSGSPYYLVHLTTLKNK